MRRIHQLALSLCLALTGCGAAPARHVQGPVTAPWSETDDEALGIAESDNAEATPTPR